MNSNNYFQLLLCSCDPHIVKSCSEAGVDGVIVEWERIEQQIDDSINFLNIKAEMSENLKKVRNSTRDLVICRLNPYHLYTEIEIETAISLGADEIWLPKVSTLKEVETIIAIVNSRSQIGIVIETIEALNLIKELTQLPLTRIHIGLNDLRDALKNPHSFCSLVDGTIENIVKNLTIPYGFGGLTLPDQGSPIPCTLLMGELIRLGCSFSLLRRSFISDTRGKDLTQEIPRIREKLTELASRCSQEIVKDHQIFSQLVHNLIK